MRAWALSIASVVVGLAALATTPGCGELDTGEQVGELCDPGEEVFCRCPSGEAGTKRCSDEGGGFAGCGPCDGEEPPEGDGGAGGGGAGGGSSSGTTPMLAACEVDAECASGACRVGYCTIECASASECPSAASCVRFAADVQVCMPACATTANCQEYGASSSCGWSLAVDGAPATVCGPWSEASLPPEGTACSTHVDCHLGNLGVESVCGSDGCMPGCVKQSDCPAGTTCAQPSPVGACQPG